MQIKPRHCCRGFRHFSLDGRKRLIVGRESGWHGRCITPCYPAGFGRRVCQANARSIIDERINQIGGAGRVIGLGCRACAGTLHARGATGCNTGTGRADARGTDARRGTARGHAGGDDGTKDQQWPEFSSLDTDGNGSISKEEVQKQSLIASRFGEIDGDKNGSLSSDEYNKALDKSKAPNP